VTLVIDASVIVAALVDDGPEGRWAEALVADNALAAPHLLPVEVAHVLRRASRAGDLSADTASLAHRELVALRVELFAYEQLEERIWGLRTTVTPYDAWYVALAERLDARLATLDRRLCRASGPRCPFLLPDPSPGG